MTTPLVEPKATMRLLRSTRFPALLLLLAAVLGLVLANSPAGAAARGIADTTVGVPGILQMSLSHWITDGLLAVFFFVAAVELRYELTSGALHTPRAALRPAIAAAGGVLTPILVYLLIAGASETAAGWPVPTATDVAFALGVLAVFGRGLPPALRVFLLALAILDDIIGIVFIAVLFTANVDVMALLLAAGLLVVFAVLSRGKDAGVSGRWVALAQAAVAIGVWAAVLASGIHATIAGVALGLVMAQQPALRVRHRLEPWVNGLVLPLFALSASLVVIPRVAVGELSPAFWGVAVALPLGKLVGIAVAGWIAQRVAGGGDRLPVPDLIAAGALGGIGFTVSLLLAELAFGGARELRDAATLGVLAGSLVSLVLAAMLVSWRAWVYRRRTIPT